jgi:hypothetical protein
LPAPTAASQKKKKITILLPVVIAAIRPGQKPVN